jgi:hypothetical protein
VPFPQHIDQVFSTFGIRADTKEALYDAYVAMGNEVLEVFADIAESVASTASISPDDALSIRAEVVQRFLTRNHERWLAGVPTPSLWRPRSLEGRASGMAVPLGRIGSRPAEGAGNEFHDRVRAAASQLLGRGQPIPNGILLLGRNAHFGGRTDTISFDIVSESLEEALALSRAEGRQHTMPGSVGETSGTLDAARSIALIWEIQPNVLKPAGERNRAIRKAYGRHRNWHLVTLLAALEWLRDRDIDVFIVRGEALAATHEVNEAKPVAPEIVTLHDRTVAAVAASLGAVLDVPDAAAEARLLESDVMNHGLRKEVEAQGSTNAIWYLRRGAGSQPPGQY